VDFNLFLLKLNISEPYAVTQEFVLYQNDRNMIFRYFVMHEKNIDWYRYWCNVV